MKYAKLSQERLADILADAREYLETHGWWRGSLVGPNGKQVCGLGAVLYSQGWNNIAGTVPVEHKDEVDQVLAAVMEQVGYAKASPEVLRKYATTNFTVWNDDIKAGAKDKQHLLDAFAKAEKIERAGFDPDAA
jgi:hypothetical protein